MKNYATQSFLSGQFLQSHDAEKSQGGGKEGDSKASPLLLFPAALGFAVMFAYWCVLWEVPNA
jgi:hypothetical protein